MDCILGRDSFLKAELLCVEADPKQLLIPEMFRRPDRFHDSGSCPQVVAYVPFNAVPPVNSRGVFRRRAARIGGAARRTQVLR